MRTRNENDVLSVHVIAGTHCVLLGFDVKGYDDQQSKPDRVISSSTVTTTSNQLSNMLSDLKLDSTELAANSTPKRTTRSSSSERVIFVGFAIDRKDCTTNKTVSLNANGNPIQKFHYGDYTVLPGRQYEYNVRRMIKTRTSSSSSTSSSKQCFAAYGSSVVVSVTTEDPTTGKHGIYFNRGVAGSKAYTEKFGPGKFHLVKKFGVPMWKSTINPRSMDDPDKSKEALAWLSRGLEEALLQFIAQASGREYRLLATVYEFTHPETLQAFASAVERGVDVKIVRHCKGTHHTRVKRNDIVKDDNGKILKDWIPDGTTESAKKAIDSVGFASLKDAHTWQHDTFIERKHSAGIMHNKFILLVENGKPIQVWTGSTNPTDGGIYGQSNVGHIVRDEDVAIQYFKYWQHLAQDPPGRKRRGSNTTNEEEDESTNEDDTCNKDVPMDEVNERLQPDLQGQVKSPSMNVIFSPRKTTDMLQWYADRMGEAKSSVHYTAAFGIAQPIAQVLSQGQKKTYSSDGLRRSPRISRRNNSKANNSDSFLRYILLDNKPSEKSSDKRGASAEKNGKEYLDYYDIKDIRENRIAFGAILSSSPSDNDNEHDNSGGESLTGLTTFVDYVHTKYMIIDALTDNPLVVTGSANFSMASTDKNDENSLVIQGDKRVADIYLTEFYRMFDHFHARDKYNDFVSKNKSSSSAKNGKCKDCVGRSWGEVITDESWLHPYLDPSSQLYRERLLLR